MRMDQDELHRVLCLSEADYGTDPLPTAAETWTSRSARRRAGRVELITGIEGVSSRTVRKIVVLDG